MSSWPFSYAPGGLVGFATANLVALVDLPTDDDLVARIAALVAGEAPTLDAVLDVLVSRGLRAVASFGLAELTGDGARVLVRGACRAEGPDHSAASGPGGLWAESTWPGVTDVRLVTDAADERILPLGGGIVFASALGFGPGALPVLVEEPQPEPERDLEPTPEPVPAVVAEPDPELAPEPEPAAEPEAAPEPEDTPEPAPDPEPEPAVAQNAGATMASPLTGPAPEGIIASVPWSLDDLDQPDDGPAEPHHGPSPAEPEADPGNTTDVAALRAQAGASDTLVVAVLCPDGHANPVHATTCRLCGGQLSAQQPVEVPRPSLGVLRLANGDVVALERGAVLGRNPRLPQGWTGEQPNLVRIDDPERDVSSQHLEVRLDAWHVLVRDLGSTNGTEVALPGSEPVLLRAHEQLSIEPGTRIMLAGVFAITYEAGA